MQPTNYHSHERPLSPDEMAVYVRQRAITAGDYYMQAAGVAAHPDLWSQPTTSAAEAVNVVRQAEQRQPVTTMTGNASFAPQPEQPRTTTAGNVITLMSQEQRLAEARRIAHEEAA